jgi:hypothetical protein
MKHTRFSRGKDEGMFYVPVGNREHLPCGPVTGPIKKFKLAFGSDSEFFSRSLVAPGTIGPFTKCPNVADGDIKHRGGGVILRSPVGRGPLCPPFSRVNARFYVKVLD